MRFLEGDYSLLPRFVQADAQVQWTGLAYGKDNPFSTKLCA